MKRRDAGYLVGWLLVIGGFLLPFADQRLTVSANASHNTTASIEEPAGAVSYLGWGMMLLGFLTLSSNHYFKLRDARRADRAEAREVHDRKRQSNDTR